MVLVASIVSVLIVIAGPAASTRDPASLARPVIVSGGTYSGVWMSGADGPAVRIRTSEPVTITNSIIAGSGELIRADPGASVTLTGVTGIGGSGRFLAATGVKLLTVKNCTINRTTGIYVEGAAASASITITRNRVRNIQAASYKTAFAQLSLITTAAIDISWNEVVNVFGQSGVEDNINLYKTAYAEVHDNYIQGAYPTTAERGFSGSGIMVDEVGSHHNHIYSNQVVDTTNAGIGISGGWNNTVHDNRVVFDGRLDDGTPLPASNVGIAVWNDVYNDPGWANNSAYGNIVGWLRPSRARADWWLPGCSGKCTNVPFTGALSRARELAEYRIWLRKLAANRIAIGAGRSE